MHVCALLQLAEAMLQGGPDPHHLSVTCCLCIHRLLQDRGVLRRRVSKYETSCFYSFPVAMMS